MVRPVNADERCSRSAGDAIGVTPQAERGQALAALSCRSLSARGIVQTAPAGAVAFHDHAWSCRRHGAISSNVLATVSLARQGQSMQSLDGIKKSIAGMDDHQLIQRWKDGLFSVETKVIAEDELRNRGIDLADPIARSSSVDDDHLSKPLKPWLLPALFAVTASATVGRELGGALAGATGAAVFAVIVAILGWNVGSAVARFSRTRQHLAIRILICTASGVAWLYLSGLGVVAARFMRATPVR